MQRDESNNSSRSSSSDERVGAAPAPAPAPAMQAQVRAAVNPFGPPAPAPAMQAQARAVVNPFGPPRAAPIPALQGQDRALVNPFGPRPPMQGQARALANPFGPPPPPQGPPIVVHGFDQYDNENARWRAERRAGRETQDRISNSLGGSQVVYNWPHNPTAAFVMGLFHGGRAGFIEANVHGHALLEFDGNWDWQTPIPTSPWRAYTLGLAIGFILVWNHIVAANFAEDQQQGDL